MTSLAYVVGVVGLCVSCFAGDNALYPPNVTHIPLDLDVPGLGAVSMSEQSSILMVQVPVGGGRVSEERASPDAKELGLQVWLLKLDGTTILQHDKPSWVAIGSFADWVSDYMIYTFDKVPSNQLAGIVLRVKGEFYCRQIGPDGAVQHPPANGAPIDQNLTKQIFDILIECQKINPGMTREELLRTFTTEGGISNARHRTYVHRRCPYVKVDVDFTSSNPAEEQPTDKVTNISKPYLAWGVID